MPTVEQLAAMSYSGGNPASKGLTAEEYRGNIAQYGETIRWWKGYDAPMDAIGPNGETVNRFGKLYIEQQLAPTVKALIYSTPREEHDMEYMLIPKGSTGITCMPDEIELAHGDKVLLPTRRVIGRVLLVPGDNCLTHPWVYSITSVYMNGGQLPEGRYTFAVDSNGVSTLYIDGHNAPALVDYLYMPLYAFHMSERNPIRGYDGERLPQRGTLICERPVE